MQDTDGQYKEFAALEQRTAHLPIGTKAQANIVSGETSTAKGTISVPGREPVEFTIREIKKFAHADKTWNGESVTLEIGKVPVPTGVVKIKLDGKTLGELDADSIKQLQAVNYVADGKPLNLKLTTISEKHNAFVIAESPNGNLLKIDKTNSYEYEGQKFNDQEYRRLTLEVPQSQNRDAVFLNGEPLGVLFLNKDKEALKKIGVLNYRKLTPVEAKIQSNFNTTMVVKVDPNTVEYPQKWIKESQAQTANLDIDDNTNVGIALRPVKEFTPNDFPAVRVIERAIADLSAEEQWWFESTGMPIGVKQGDVRNVKGGFWDEELKPLTPEQRKFYKDFWGTGPALTTHNHPTNNPVNGFTNEPIGQRYAPLSGGDLIHSSWLGIPIRAVNSEYAGGVVHEFKPGLAYQTDVREVLDANPNITLNPSKLESQLQNRQYYMRDENDELVPIEMTEQDKPTYTTYELPVYVATPQMMEHSFSFNQAQREVEQTVSPVQQSLAKEETASILQKIKERPTLLFASEKDKEFGITKLVVDNHKVDVVVQWLAQKNVAITQTLPEKVPLETKKGLAVFNLVNSSIPEPTFDLMTKKFGSVIESPEQYQAKVRSLPDRPKYLKPPQPVISTTKVQTVANTVASPQVPPSPPTVSTVESIETETLSPLPKYTLSQAEVFFSPAPPSGEPIPIKLPDSKSANSFLPIEILGKIKPEKVNQLRSHLETYIKPVLEEDRSNYAPGRKVAWVGAKWDLKNKDFTAGVQDDRLMELIKQIYPDADIALVTYSETSGAGINYHRDDSYAAVEARSINIGNSEWGYRAAKEQMVWTKNENTSALYQEFNLESGIVIRFNCKNEHAALNTEAGRWSINTWSIKNDLGREQSVRHSFENFLASNQPPRAVIQSTDDLTVKTHEWIPGGEIKVERSYASIKEATRNSLQQSNQPKESQTQPITVEDLRQWWRTANHLGRSKEYKDRIAQIGNEFEATGQISDNAIEAMRKDTVSRVAQIAHKFVSVWGQAQPDGSTRVQGKMYDLSFHPQRQDWAITHKNGDVIVDVQAGKVVANNITSDFLQDFETANSKLDESIANKQKQAARLQR